MSDSLQLHGLQHTKLPYPSPTHGSSSNSCPLSWWCHQPPHPLSSLLLLPSTFPSIKVFSNESVLPIGWPKYWSFSFSISPFNEQWLKHNISFSYTIMRWICSVQKLALMQLLRCRGPFLMLFHHPQCKTVSRAIAEVVGMCESKHIFLKILGLGMTYLLTWQWLNSVSY